MMRAVAAGTAQEAAWRSTWPQSLEQKKTSKCFVHGVLYAPCLCFDTTAIIQQYRRAAESDCNGKLPNLGCKQSVYFKPKPRCLLYIYSELRRVNCSFYFKIGACRHGDRCSRLHNKPTFSQVSWEYSFSRSSELGRLTVLPITGVIFIVYIVSAPSFPKPSALCFIPDDFVAKYVPESSKCSTSGRRNK